ncbi:MAG: crossover junction endodeoxyribonuclease RuvC [Candidatus Vogelbacteria bacterium]|nr:crossover junction endodeoxyribonuclease RuvC [Candidatus Vogelbacteria bacterium]
MLTRNYSLQTTHSPKTLRVLAVDPGYERMGIAVLERIAQKDSLLYSDCVITPKIEFNERLLLLGRELEKVIKKWKPNVLAIEKLFFAANQKTALNVAEVKGMVTYIASSNGLTFKEFAPNEVKLAVASYGRADKKQVTDMLHKLLKIEKQIKHDDEYDAIAVGLTCLAQSRFV